MRKFLVAATLSTLILIPAAARAGFLVEASLGKGYQASPSTQYGDSRWEQLNLNIAPGYAPSLPVLSWFHLQLGIVTDFGDKAGTKTNLELRPMLSLVPPLLPIYGRVMFLVDNVFDRGGGAKREKAFGAAVGVRIGTPSIGAVPAMGIFAELGALPRSREFSDGSKVAWILEGRVGAYLNF
ncbi:MAG TPA: hypothetical protein VIM14_08080 [Polyangia bacterium]|jgi:hypothetical protein